MAQLYRHQAAKAIVFGNLCIKPARPCRTHLRPQPQFITRPFCALTRKTSFPVLMPNLASLEAPEIWHCRPLASGTTMPSRSLITETERRSQDHDVSKYPFVWTPISKVWESRIFKIFITVHTIAG